MNKIPTAKEFAEANQYELESHDEGGYLGIDTDEFARKLIEFANIHREAILKAAAENAEYKQEWNGNIYGSLNKDSILNAYPKELIN